MTLPAIQDFILHAGSTFNELIEWRNEDNEIQDLNDYTGQMDVRDDTGTLLISFTTASGITATDEGQAVIALTAEQTAELEPGSYSYDLLFWDAGGTVTPLLGGMFIVRPLITVRP